MCIRDSVPQVRKQVPSDRRLQIGGAARAPGSRLGADGPFHHPDVAVSPLGDSLVEVDEPLANLGTLHVAAVHVEENLLNLVVGIDRPPVIAVSYTHLRA